MRHKKRKSAWNWLFVCCLLLCVLSVRTSSMFQHITGSPSLTEQFTILENNLALDLSLKCSMCVLILSSGVHIPLQKLFKCVCVVWIDIAHQFQSTGKIEDLTAYWQAYCSPTYTLHTLSLTTASLSVNCFGPHLKCTHQSICPELV